MKKERGQDHYNSRRGVEQSGCSCYFGVLDGGCVAEYEKEQAQQAVGDKERDVSRTDAERGAVSGADQETDRDGGAEHAQEYQGVLRQAHGAEYGDESAVQSPEHRAGDDHGGGGGITLGFVS